jgi:hypothetical protein
MKKMAAHGSRDSLTVPLFSWALALILLLLVLGLMLAKSGAFGGGI